MQIQEQPARVFAPVENRNSHWTFVIRINFLERHALDLAKELPRRIIEPLFGIAVGDVLELESFFAVQEVSRNPTARVMLSNQNPVFVRRNGGAVDDVNAGVLMKSGKRSRAVESFADTIQTS